MNQIKKSNNYYLAWRQSIWAFVLLMALVLFLFQDTFWGMVSIWLRSETFTHGFFVAPIVGWLVWRQRELISSLQPRINFWFLIPILGVTFIWTLGDLAFVNSVTQLSAVALLVLLVPAIFGWEITSVIVFPLFFLFFSVPLGEFLFPQLMEWTANFTVMALRFSGVPVYREGLQFVIPSGNWSVVEACSGVRYLIASLTVGTLFAYLNYQSFRRRVLFVLVSIAVPIFANWMRAYLIVMLGHFSGNTLAVGVDHIIYGWLFFGLVIILMFMAGARWAEPSPVTVKVASLNRASVAGNHAGAVLALFCAISLVVALPHLGQRLMHDDGSVSAARKAEPLTLESGWRYSTENNIEFKPVFKNTSFEINNNYVKDGESIGLYIGYYHQQNYEKKLVSSDNVLVLSNDHHWASAGSGSQLLDFGQTRFPVRTTELRDISLVGQRTDDRLVVWQVYWVGGMLTADDHLAKIYSVFQRLLGRRDDSAVIILYTEKKENKNSTEILRGFLTDNIGSIRIFLENKF